MLPSASVVTLHLFFVSRGLNTRIALINT